MMKLPCLSRVLLGAAAVVLLTGTTTTSNGSTGLLLVQAQITDDSLAETDGMDDDGGLGPPPPTGTCDDYLRDMCREDLQMDGECEPELYGASALCGTGTDCFDCDPCQQHSYDCTGCLGDETCYWCPGDAKCLSMPLDDSFFGVVGKTSSCPDVADWKSASAGDTCSTVNSGHFFSDPLYASMEWMYDAIRVRPVWELGFRGTGIHVRVNDDGVDPDHPEFAARYDVANSCTAYAPINGTEPHGTACASIILGEANNDACAVGIAPGATVSSCAFAEDFNEEDEATMLATNLEVLDISSNSWGPTPCSLKGEFDWRRNRFLQLEECIFDPNHEESPCETCAGNVMSVNCEKSIVYYCANYYENDPVACVDYLDLYVDCEYHVLPTVSDDVFKKAALEGRNGLGTIFVFAGGNDYVTGNDVNMDGFVNSRYTVSVGAVGKNGLHASYSTPGAALLVSAPGGDIKEDVSANIVANPTGAGGGCHDSGDGTSFACPVVAGVVALILEASNNTLGWRDVQGILVSTSRRTDEVNGTWTVNGAGYSHSYKYGYGIIDAAAAVNASLAWANFGPEQQILLDSGVLDLEIQNDGEAATATTSSVVVAARSDDFVVESVVVYIDILHASRGDLLVELESPSGTVSILHPSKRSENTLDVDLNDDKRWKLTTVRNFYETPSGNWTLRITDEDEQKVTGCIDLPYDTEIQDDTGIFWYNCSEVEAFEDCAGGTVLFPDAAGTLDEENGRTGVEACCACGGGVEAPVIDILHGWRMIIYGHNSTVASAITPDESAAAVSKKTP